MEAVTMTGDGGSSSIGSGSTVSKEEVVVEQDNQPMEGSDESELELGLGLSLGVAGFKNYKQIPRIWTAKDLPSLVSKPLLPPSPSSASSCSSLALRAPAASASGGNSNNSTTAGTERAASPSASQVVGWPPIRAYRMYSMANQSKSVATGENSSQFEESKGKDVIYGGNSNPEDRVAVKSSLFVKVNMDGVAIGRKVDLNAHSSYESLAQTLEDMFSNKAVEKSRGNELVLLPKVTRPSKLLDRSSEYVLTYEDKDGDWMLIGDVPWGMFISSVKRLKIMRTSEANGLVFQIFHLQLQDRKKGALSKEAGLYRQFHHVFLQETSCYPSKKRRLRHRILRKCILIPSNNRCCAHYIFVSDQNPRLIWSDFLLNSFGFSLVYLLHTCQGGRYAISLYILRMGGARFCKGFFFRVSAV